MQDLKNRVFHHNPNVYNTIVAYLDCSHTDFKVAMKPAHYTDMTGLKYSRNGKPCIDGPTLLKVFGVESTISSGNAPWTS